MKSKKFSDKIIIRLDRGEEVVETLKEFCRKNEVKLGQITGLGAVGRVKLGYFDTGKKKYYSQEFSDGYEVTSLLGNICEMAGEVYLHLHATITDRNYNCLGGHLESAVVSGTFEAIIETIDGKIEREFNEDVGLNLFKF